MAVVQLSEIESLPDILSTEHFTLNLGTIPGVGDGYSLLLKCLDCAIPGFGNEAFEVALHGTVRNFRGRKTYPRTLAVNIVEDVTMDTCNKLRTWHEQIVGSNGNVSIGNIADYSVQALLTIYDQAGNAIDNITFVNLFIQDVPDIQVSGEQSQAMHVACTFKYDWINFANTNIL